MSKHEVFERMESRAIIGYGQHGADRGVLLEEIYQAFKSRLIAELTVDGWSQCGRIGGELKDKAIDAHQSPE